MKHSSESQPQENASLFSDSIDLASEKMGSFVVSVTDEYFAACQNMLKEGDAVDKPEEYTERGKWMDGWESRRKRGSGFDHCVIQLGAPGIVRGFDIDTSHFLGNHAPAASVEACLETKAPTEHTEWFELLSKKDLRPGSHHFFSCETLQSCSHIRLNIYPDGGVARLRVFGEVDPERVSLPKGKTTEVSSAINGGRTLLCSDMFFSHMHNIILPTDSVGMADGWETKRRRGMNWEEELPERRFAQSGFDWVLLKLACPSTVNAIQVDTKFFRGNFPYSCEVLGTFSSEESPSVLLENAAWVKLLTEQKLSADERHVFDGSAISNQGEPISHIKFHMYPDGGISRLKIFGQPV